MPAVDDFSGLLAEFRAPDTLLDAARRIRRAGYRDVDAFTPFPIDGLAEILGFRATTIGWLALAGGLIGAIGGLYMQWYANVVSYSINIGGRPLAAWPAFVLPAFELAVLFATLGAVLGMLVGNRLPRLHHPVFDVPDFHLASSDRFFLYIGRGDGRFDDRETRALLDGLKPTAVFEVPA